MKWAAAILFYCTLHKLILSTFSAKQCDLANKYAPINLNTDSAIAVSTPSPLLFTLDNNDHLTVKNTGKTVEITLAQPKTISGVTGGILGKRFYMQYKIRYFWNQDYSGDCSFSVDQSKYPLNLEFVFFYEKCGSYENARKQPGSIVVLRVPATVEGVVPNPSFVDFGNILGNITNAGSSFTVKGSTRKMIYKWFDVNTVHYPYYYTYEGLFIDKNQNETTPNEAIYIICPKTTTGYVSTTQFNRFKCLKSYTGSPLASIESGFKATNQLIKQAKGIDEKVFNEPPPPSHKPSYNFQWELPDVHVN